MLHVIAKSDIHMRLRPLQTNQYKDEDIVLISLTGIKTIPMQHDVVEVLHDLGLDVTRATMDKARGGMLRERRGGEGKKERKKDRKKEGKEGKEGRKEGRKKERKEERKK